MKSLTSYGAFVDIGGVDGMVHISELSWSRIKHPSEVVKVGDTVDVYVISADPEKKKISLGMKDHSRGSLGRCSPPPTRWATWPTFAIVKLMTFGAFAEIVPGVDGLIHISQIADHRIDKPERRAGRGPDGGREDHRHRLWTTRRSPCPSAPCSTTPAPLTGTSTTTNFRTSTAETNTKKGELPLRQFPFFCWERAAEVCGPYTAPTEYEK